MVNVVAYALPTMINCNIFKTLRLEPVKLGVVQKLEFIYERYFDWLLLLK